MEEKLSKSRRQLLSRLNTKKMRGKTGLLLVEGRKSIMDLLGMCDSDTAWLPEYILTTSESLESIRGYMKMKGVEEIPFYLASQSDMREISSLSTPPDVIAVCRLPERRTESEILASTISPDLYIMLDGIQDPGNLGTIIRTAHWFGIRRIFASYDTVDLYNPKVVQSTMGSLAKVSVDYVDLEKLSDANPDIPLIGLLLEGKNIYKACLPSNAFIVMGNEGNGLSDALRKRLSMALTIPPYDPSNHSESLNVAIATAITLSEFRR